MYNLMLFDFLMIFVFFVNELIIMKNLLKQKFSGRENGVQDLESRHCGTLN